MRTIERAVVVRRFAKSPRGTPEREGSQFRLICLMRQNERSRAPWRVPIVFSRYAKYAATGKHHSN
jgi:hypothetical protein